MESVIIKVFAPTVIAFVIGVLITPLVTHYLYKHRVWKKTGGKQALDGKVAEVFNKLKGEDEIKTPRMGGIVIWASVFLTVLALLVVKSLWPESAMADLAFVSRSQTWIPLAGMAVGALVGFLNDFYDVTKGGAGLSLRVRLGIITALSGSIGWWFYSKLGISSVGIPFDGYLELGWLIIPLFVLVTMAFYASGVIDGIDGLSGGVFTSIFAGYAGVAFMQSQYDLAALCATIAGAVLAFLWFNIPPARFWMTETGTMALTLTLAVIVFMTDKLGEGHGIALFAVIGLPLVATVASNVLQVLSKKIRGKKLFHIAPLHHHFEAIGWPSYKVTMRYWVISIACALLGLALAPIV